MDEKVAGELAPTWKAHLYINKMKLRDDKLSQVLTGALGRYTVGSLRNAALTTLPTLSSLRGGGGGGQGKSGCSSTSNNPTASNEPLNDIEKYLNIRKQVEQRRKNLFPVQPKPPNDFKNYLMNRKVLFIYYVRTFIAQNSI